MTSETAAEKERITLTRRELEALVDEAIKKDRACTKKYVASAGFEPLPAGFAAPAQLFA